MHFVTNFLAAAAVAHARGIEPEAMARAAPGLRAARHRGERLHLGQGITLLDDSYNSSPEALQAALLALGMVGGERRVVILGDMLELGPRAPELHRALGESVAARADVLLAVGPLARHYLEGAQRAGRPAPALHAFADADAAASAAPGLVRPGDAVLVKGSRGVRLEAVVDALRAGFGEVAG
jgi:UDP-N-acetylmuramoyl-tripeptide--D-alanyl-D-alanine ligase